MRLLNKLLIIILTVAMLFTTLPVSAAQKIGNCRVFFSLANNTNGAFIDAVTVIMTNSELDLEYSFEIQYIDYMLNYDVGGSVKKGEYTISFEYFSKDEFEIKNADGTPFSDSFTADMDTYTFEWTVEYKNGKEPPKIESENFVVSEEADALYQRFVELITPMIDTNENLRSHIKTLGERTLSNDLKLMKKNKRDIEGTGRTAEEWLSLSVFDRYIGYITVVKPHYLNQVIEWEGLEDWNNKIVENERWFHERNTTEELFDAYDELSEWSYYYFEENGVMFDFLKNAELLHGEHADIPVTDTSDISGSYNSSDNADNETSEIYVEGNSFSDNDAVSSEASNGGIWDEPLDAFMHSIVFFLIFGIVIAVIVCVVLYRRRQSR